MGNILWSKSSASVKDDKTRGVKRKTCPDSLTPIKRKRLSQSDDPTTERRGVKRKATEDGEGEPTKKKEKKGRLAFNLFGFNLFGFNLFGKESASSSKDSGKAAADDKGPNTKKKRRPDLKKARQSAFLRAEFEAKYKQQDQLGEGGCGTVFGGYRKADNLPVAIKHIPEENILYQHVNGTRKQLCVEVAIMLKMADKRCPPVGMSASVSLLDWYNLDQELILVMERPIPAEDLHHYIDNNGGSLPEQEAKIILKQLVDAAIDLEKKKIFHRDIKSENILIETSSDVPRVRLIDFGLSCFVKRGACYRIFCGTYNFISPELFSHGWYRAGPTTVWQMGVVLFETLHDADFETIKFLEKRLRISETLSKNCQDFLQRCLTRDPKQRPTLEQLRLHPKENVRNSFIVILQDKVKLQKSSLKENVRNSFIVILQDEVMLQKNSLKENVRNSCF